MTRWLAGDIGGTKTILRLLQTDSPIVAEKIYPSASYPHLNHIIKDFLAEVGGEGPQAACLAIAGPVINNTCQLSNLHWLLDGEEMQASLGIPHVQLINDFAAVGYGILGLHPDDLVVLQDQPAVPEGTIAVLGAGTGLGEALLFWERDQYKVIALEGGHTDFAARNPLEIGLLQFLLEQHQRVSVERVVSGMGIPVIYQYLRQSQFAPESPVVAAALAQEDAAAVIARHALAKTDRLCEQTLEMFVAAYGAEAGNLALKSLPSGGVYIAGGVAPKILAKMEDGTFIANFLNKGRMRPLLEKMRVSLILNPKVGLLGAGLLAERLQP